MNARETTQLIEAAGGDMAFAALLGIDDEPKIAQRVNNWKRRGLPKAVQLDHYYTIADLKRRLLKLKTRAWIKLD